MYYPGPACLSASKSRSFMYRQLCLIIHQRTHQTSPLNSADPLRRPLDPLGPPRWPYWPLNIPLTCLDSLERLYCLTNHQRTHQTLPLTAFDPLTSWLNPWETPELTYPYTSPKSPELPSNAPLTPWGPFMFPTWPPLTSLLSFLASRLIVCFCLCAYVFIVERSYPPVASGWLFVCEFVCVCLCWWEVSSTCSQRQADGDGLKTDSAETRDGVRWASDQLIIIMLLVSVLCFCGCFYFFFLD